MATCGINWTDNGNFQSCIGVAGMPGFDKVQQKALLDKFDADPICKMDATPKQIDLKGVCNASAGNSINLASNSIFHVGSKEIDTVRDASLNAIGLTALNKKWGSSDKWQNNGVSKDNVYYITGEDVEYKGEILKNQTVLGLEVHGDLYSGDTFGVDEKRGIKKGDIPTCNESIQADKKRVGACIATKDNYGGGKYTVKAMVPRTTDTKTDGRGYVFAIWSFHYEEIYSDKGISKSTQWFGNTDALTQACYKTGEDTDTATDPSDCINKLQGVGICQFKAKEPYYWDCFQAINHEIDIEIPANSPQFVDDPSKIGWNTMNANTWIFDNNKYGGDADQDKTFYQQAQIVNKNSSFISEHGEYHTYSYDWDTESRTVKFYFDDELVFTSDNFVPTRAGKLIVGGWLGWWALSANYDRALIKIAEITIEPRGDPLNFPQTYDQILNDDTNVNCDYSEINNLPPYTKTQPPIPTPNPPTPVETSVNHEWMLLGWVIFFFLLLILLFFIKYEHRKK